MLQQAVKVESPKRKSKKLAEKRNSLPLLMDSKELQKRAAMVGAETERVRMALATYENDVGPG